jgi:hypothetical protein
MSVEPDADDSAANLEPARILQEKRKHFDHI